MITQEQQKIADLETEVSILKGKVDYILERIKRRTADIDEIFENTNLTPEDRRFYTGEKVVLLNLFYEINR